MKEVEKLVQKFKQEVREKTIYEFAYKMIIMMPGHKEDILLIAEQLKGGDEDGKE